MSIDYYEILQVQPNASQEIIQTAYRTLVKKYHPDIYPNKNEATKIMSLLNNAYEVLSDPQKRKNYDRDYFKINNLQFGEKTNKSPSQKNKTAPILYTFWGTGFRFCGKDAFDPAASSYTTQYWFTFFYLPLIPFGNYRVIRKKNKYILIHKIPLEKSVTAIAKMYYSKPFSLILLTIAFTLALYPLENQSVNSSGPQYTQSQKQSPQPATAFLPKNNVTTKYAANEPIERRQGNCKINIDNRSNPFPVLARLWNISANSRPVRTFTIKQGEEFTVDNLSPGNYEIRYMPLYEKVQSVDAFKTESFLLTQIETAAGLKYDTITLRLYNTPSEPTKKHPIKIDEV